MFYTTWVQSIHIRMYFPLEIKLHFGDTKLIIFESIIGVKIIFSNALHLFYTALKFCPEAVKGSLTNHGGSDHLENWKWTLPP